MSMDDYLLGGMIEVEGDRKSFPNNLQPALIAYQDEYGPIPEDALLKPVAYPHERRDGRLMYVLVFYRKKAASSVMTRSRKSKGKDND